MEEFIAAETIGYWLAWVPVRIITSLLVNRWARRKYNREHAGWLALFVSWIPAMIVVAMMGKKPVETRLQTAGLDIAETQHGGARPGTAWHGEAR